MRIAKRIGCTGISVLRAVDVLNKPVYVTEAHALGLAIMIGAPVDNPNDMEQLRALGVDRFESENIP